MFGKILLEQKKWVHNDWYLIYCKYFIQNDTHIFLQILLYCCSIWGSLNSWVLYMIWFLVFVNRWFIYYGNVLFLVLFDCHWRDDFNVLLAKYAAFSLKCAIKIKWLLKRDVLNHLHWNYFDREFLKAETHLIIYYREAN